MSIHIKFLVFFLLIAVMGCGVENEFDFDSERYRPAETTDMVGVPAGTFQMGSDYSPGIDIIDGIIDEPFSDEHPEHTVFLNAYFIERTEVTNAQYRACVLAGGCVDPYTKIVLDEPEYYTNPGFDDYPVVNVTWPMADDYCRWRGRRLPTEAEWEKAARGEADDRIYPWGWLEPTCGMANISIPRNQLEAEGESILVETCNGFPVPVGLYTSWDSPYDVLDMTGNAAEWVADYYAADYYDSETWPGNADNPAGPAAGERRVVRGGSFAAGALYVRVSFRETKGPRHFDAAIGFRCAGDVE